MDSYNHTAFHDSTYPRNETNLNTYHNTLLSQQTVMPLQQLQSTQQMQLPQVQQYNTTTLQPENQWVNGQFYSTHNNMNSFHNDYYSNSTMNLHQTLYNYELPTNGAMDLQPEPQYTTYTSNMLPCDVRPNLESVTNKQPYLKNQARARANGRYRTPYDEHTKAVLEAEYNMCEYITAERKQHLSMQLNLSNRQIKIWFQNRRAKKRRNVKKSTGSTLT